MKPTLVGYGGKYFEGNGPRRECVVGEPIFYRLVQTMPAHIVQFRRQGAGHRGLSKNSTLHHAQIWGRPLILRFHFAGMPRAYKAQKFGEKISACFRDMNLWMLHCVI